MQRGGNRGQCRRELGRSVAPRFPEGRLDVAQGIVPFTQTFNLFARRRLGVAEIVQGAAGEAGVGGQHQERLDHLVGVARDAAQAGNDLIRSDAALVGSLDVRNHAGIVAGRDGVDGHAGAAGAQRYVAKAVHQSALRQPGLLGSGGQACRLLLRCVQVAGHRAQCFPGAVELGGIDVQGDRRAVQCPSFGSVLVGNGHQGGYCRRRQADAAGGRRPVRPQHSQRAAEPVQDAAGLPRAFAQLAHPHRPLGKPRFDRCLLGQRRLVFLGTLAQGFEFGAQASGFRAVDALRLR